jgi:aminopeptidase
MSRGEILAAYAEVIIRTGVNLQKGQPLLIRTEVVQREFAQALAREAYRRGAPLVSVLYSDGVLGRMRIDETLEDGYLDYVPSFTEVQYSKYVEDGWTSVSLRGPEDPDVMEGADPERMGRAGKAASMTMRGFLKSVSANRITWNVCLFPTEAWARSILGDTGDWERDIWEVLIPILRLDRKDPAAAWLEHDAELKRRAAHMNRARYDGIRFVGPGTDLFIGMQPNRRFEGGRAKSTAGVPFFPNIPTEEIFSTPDHARTSGRVTCTRPVEVLGSQVEGAWFRFENGSVVEFGAEKNAGLLEQYLDFDEGAKALGEVALVDISSPIYRSGMVFRNILFDENASCHIALGNGYADCIDGGTEMTEEELKQTRCNSSLVHTDFMIGSDAVSVFGVRPDGREEPVMKNGSFVI